MNCKNHNNNNNTNINNNNNYHSKQLNDSNCNNSTSIVHLFQKISDQMEMFSVNCSSSRIQLHQQSQPKNRDNNPEQYKKLQKEFYLSQEWQIEQMLQKINQDKNNNENKNKNKEEIMQSQLQSQSEQSQQYKASAQISVDPIFSTFLTLMLSYLKQINKLINNRQSYTKCNCKDTFQTLLMQVRKYYDHKSAENQRYATKLLLQYEEKCTQIQELNLKIFDLQSRLHTFQQISLAQIDQIDQIDQIIQTMTKKIANSNLEINTAFKATQNIKNTKKCMIINSTEQKNATKKLNMIKKILQQKWDNNTLQKQKSIQASYNQSRITDFSREDSTHIRQSSQISHKKYFEYLNMNTLNITKEKTQQVKVKVKAQYNQNETFSQDIFLNTNSKLSISNILFSKCNRTTNSHQQNKSRLASKILICDNEKGDENKESIFNFFARKSIFSKSSKCSANSNINENLSKNQKRQSASILKNISNTNTQSQIRSQLFLS